MTNNNIISTPNITGNIGSCTSQLQKVVDYSGFYKTTGNNIVTNSCTGQVTTTPFVEVNWLMYPLAFVVVFTLLIIMLGWVFHDK